MSSDDSKKSKLLYKNWNQDKSENISKQKRRSKSVSPKRKSIIEDWYIIPEVWRAYEIIYEVHTSLDQIWKLILLIEKYWTLGIDGIICLKISEIFALNDRYEKYELRSQGKMLW